MNDVIETKHEEWLSTAGCKQECWVILRNGWELGRIQQFDKYMAMKSNGSYKHKYFARFNRAVDWLVREMRNTRPISELNHFLV